MPQGELIFANVLDSRQRAAEGELANGVVYTLGLGLRALPFFVLRTWKAPTGYVSEEVELIAPSGEVAHRVGPAARFMVGAMDLTPIETLVEDATFTETGGYLASFRLDGDVVAQAEFQVALQATPAKLPQPYEDGLKRSDVIWVGVDAGDDGSAKKDGPRFTRGNLAPAWFAYKGGKIYVLSSRERSAAEQTLPGVPGSNELIIVTRRKGRDTSLERFRASARALEGDEWEEAAKLLVDRRRSRVGPPEESIERWRGACDIAELTPIVPA
ncbi:MAG TPA: hypothetical protein VGH10_13270 [Actinomycetota bacterium]|jgi:hypothetical protein